MEDNVPTSRHESESDTNTDDQSLPELSDLPGSVPQLNLHEHTDKKELDTYNYLPQVRVNSAKLTYSNGSDLNGTHQKGRKTPLRQQSSYIYNLSIWQIIRDNLVSELKGQLESNSAIITSTDSAGYSPIHVSAKYDRLPCLQLLIEWKADPNFPGPYDMYPLHLAARYNSVDSAKFLLSHKAAPMCRDCKQKTPLHHAARKGHLGMVELLLAYPDCHVDALDEDKLTPLHEAIMLKQPHVANYLIEKGADIEARDISKGSPLLMAASEGLTSIIEIILDKKVSDKSRAGTVGFLNQSDNEGTSALHLAVQNNKPAVIKLLLKNGTDVNIQNNNNYTPLHMAVIGGHIEILKLLLEFGANVESRDGDHMTPVHRAAMYGQKEVLEVLLQKGANMSSRTSEQMTPLMLASWKGHLKTAEFMLDHTSRLTATDSCMRTALHWCVEHNHYQILQALIGRRGNVLLGAVDHTDQTVTHYAARTGNTMIMKMLLEHAVPLDARDQEGRTPLHVAAIFGNFATIEILIEQSTSETNDADSDGRTPLMLACLHGHYKAARSLLALGADNSVRDENYCTALILAASKGQWKVMQLLIENLAEMDVTDKLKNSAMHMAAAGGHKDAVTLLLNKGATPTFLNSYRKSPLDMAMDYEQSDVAEVMLKHKKWVDILNIRDDEGFSPMRRLIRKAPEAAMIVLDRCVEESDHRRDDMEYTLKYDYKYVDPGPDDPCCQKRRYYALNTMIEYNREELLSHPLTQSLLIMKWRKYGRFVLYSNLFVYALYVVILNTYMITVPPIQTNLLDHVRSCPIYLTDAELQNQTLVDYYIQNGQSERLKLTNPFIHSLQIILDVFICMLILKEIFLFIGQRWRYFVSLYTYCNWMMLVATLFFINPPMEVPCESNWRGAWISSLCAWFLLISYLQKLDVIGIYFVMFSEVFLSILKVLIVLVVFLCAFAQAFSAVLGQVSGFKPDDYFPLTVLAMTLGELNYIDNFVIQNNYPFTIDAYIIMTLFMIAMPIALMNLLIGIAVGDIDKIQKQAYIKRIGLQADQVNETEDRFPQVLQKKVYRRFFRIKPNEEKNTRWARFKYHVFGWKTEVEFIGQSEKDFTVESLQELKRNVRKNKTQLTTILSVQKNQQELLHHLCDHFHLEVRDNYDVTSITSDRTEMPSRMDFV